jgi:hypothetical protein
MQLDGVGKNELTGLEGPDADTVSKDIFIHDALEETWIVGIHEHPLEYLRSQRATSTVGRQ